MYSNGGISLTVVEKALGARSRVSVYLRKQDGMMCWRWAVCIKNRAMLSLKKYAVIYRTIPSVPCDKREGQDAQQNDSHVGRLYTRTIIDSQIHK